VGDILVWYSLSGVLAYLFWRMRPGWLAFWALLFLGVGTALYALFQWSLPYWPEEARQGNAVWWSPPPEVIQHRLDTYRSGWLTQMSERIPTAAALHTFVYVIYALWRTLGMMLAGMALIKWGILSAERSRGFYVRTAIVALVVGLPITAWGAWQNYTHGWSMDYSQFGGHLFNYWGSVAVTLGYIALIMLWHHSCSLSGLKSTLANVGRMAFSCYILQTVICTTLFFGHGFALYGRVPRWGQMLIVLAVWAVVIAFANWWLARFRYGPLEWLWRSLTYGRKQPFSLTS
jgi:uncharacterized protein